MAHDLGKLLVEGWSEDELKKLCTDNIDVTGRRARANASTSSKPDAK